MESLTRKGAAEILDRAGITVVDYIDPVDGSRTPAVSLQDLVPVVQRLVAPEVLGEDIAEHFVRLLKAADEGAYVYLEDRGERQRRMLSTDCYVEIEPLLAEFLKPYVEEAIKARPITVKVEDPDGAAERRRVLAYLGQRQTGDLHESALIGTLMRELERGEHLNIAEMHIAVDPR